MDTYPDAEKAVELMAHYAETHRLRTRISTGSWNGIAIHAVSNEEEPDTKKYDVVVGLEAHRKFDERAEKVIKIAEELGVFNLVSAVNVAQLPAPRSNLY
jgi:hypothetical protein